MKRFSKTTAMASLALTVVVVGGASLVNAHGGAKGVVKERMDLMKGMADAMKVMGPMFKGEAPFQPEIVAEKAAYLAEHADKIPHLTPEGSNEHPSEALPAIWQDWDRYVAEATLLGEEGAKLVAIAKNGADLDETRAQFVRVSKTCGTCHDDFRKPKE